MYNKLTKASREAELCTIKAVKTFTIYLKISQCAVASITVSYKKKTLKNKREGMRKWETLGI